MKKYVNDNQHLRDWKYYEMKLMDDFTSAEVAELIDQDVINQIKKEGLNYVDFKEIYTTVYLNPISARLLLDSMYSMIYEKGKKLDHYDRLKVKSLEEIANKKISDFLEEEKSCIDDLRVLKAHYENSKFTLYYLTLFKKVRRS
ncbi:MAG: hypothetical protein QXD62_00840 [Candidatus Woesearchaeota archaeon]